MFEFCCDNKTFNPIRMVGNRSRIGCCLFAIAISIAVFGGNTANAWATFEQKPAMPGGLGIDIVLIDSTMARSRDIQQAARRGVQVIIFDGHRESPDNILQRAVGRALLNKREIRSLSIVSHGSEGVFKFGKRWIDATGLLDDAGAWQALDRVMNDFGHIYLYGCNVAGDQKAGADLLEALSNLTHAIVFASDDITGQGGDWDLEATSTRGETRPGLTRIEVLDTSALVDLPISLPSYIETDWSGTNTFTDGAISFTLSLTAGGTIDWSYDGGTNTLTISDNDFTTSASSLTITDNNGGLLIDLISLDTDLGTIDSTTDIGTRVQIAESVQVDHMVVDGGNGTIAEVLFQGLGSQDLGVVQIDANVTTLAVQPGMDLAAGTDLAVVGNVAAITGINAFNEGAFITVDGELGSMGVGWAWGGKLTVGGDVDTITIFNNFLNSGAIAIGGSVTTVLDLNADMKGTITVGGNLTDMSVGNNWDGTLTVAGDAGTIFSTNDLFASGLIDIGGNVSDITVNSELDGTIIIGGDTDAISIGFQGAGDITVGGDLNSFFSMHEYYGVLTAKKVIGPFVISVDAHSWDGFFYDTDFPMETLVVYTWATSSISSYLTMDLDADDSSGESPVDFASALIAGNGPVAAVDADAFIGNSALNLTSLTATILDLQDGASEVLTCNTNGTAINASYNPANGTLTLSNPDTVSHYGQVLRTITYNNTAGIPTEGIRRIVFAASNASGSLVTNSATAFIAVSLSGANNSPFGADGTLSVAEDTTYVLSAADFSYVDIDGDPLAQVQITAVPLSGILAYNTGAVTLDQVIGKADIDLGLLTFTPAPNANGSGYAGFDFKVHDGSDYSAGSYTLTVDVTATNDAPTGADGTVVMVEDTTYALQAVDFGYSDIESNPLVQVQITALPLNGILAYNAVAVTLNQVISKADIDLGLLAFTPELDVFGNDYANFDFKVHDGSEYSALSYTLSVNVIASNDAPEGPGSTIVMAEDTTYTLTTVDFGYDDPDGDPLNRVKITALPSNGTLSYNGVAVFLNQVIIMADITLGLLTYTPEANNYGTGYSNFRFRVHDGTQYASAFGTLLFDVAPVNDPPSISDHHFIIERSIAKGGLVGTVQASDADPEDTLVYAISDQNSGELFVMDSGSGAVSLNESVDITKANVSFYSFSAQVSDGNTSRNANITVQILETDEDSGSGFDNATDDGTLPPVILGIKPENSPDIETEVLPVTSKPQKPSGPQEPVAEDNVGDTAETSRDESRAPTQPYQNNLRPAVLPHSDRVDQPVATSPKPSPGSERRYPIPRTSESSVGKLLQPEAMPVDMNAPQHILDIPLDNIEMEGREASTWFGKLFVGTITILMSFLSLLATWGFQGTSLLASTLSTIPLWRTFDPLPILDTEHEGDPSQLQNDSAAEGGRQDIQDRAEAMFDSDDNGKPRQKGRRDLQ